MDDTRTLPVDPLATNVYEIKNAQHRNHIACDASRTALVGSTIFGPEDRQSKPVLWSVTRMGNDRYRVCNWKYPELCAVACEKHQFVVAQERGDTPEQWIIEQDNRLEGRFYKVELFVGRRNTHRVWTLESGDFGSQVTLDQLDPVPVDNEHGWEFVPFTQPQQEEQTAFTWMLEIAGDVAGRVRMGWPLWRILENHAPPAGDDPGHITRGEMAVSSPEAMPEPPDFSA